MTGPEHYRESQRMLKVAQSELKDASTEIDPIVSERHLRHVEIAQRFAQVHAALAVAAASAENNIGMEPEMVLAWGEVTR